VQVGGKFFFKTVQEIGAYDTLVELIESEGVSRAFEILQHSSLVLIPITDEIASPHSSVST
jgi:hypothetical protein